jgi:hypothetical protein
MNAAQRLSRLQRVQDALITRMAAEVGASYGLTAEEVLAEAYTLLSWPPEVLQRELAAFREEEP